MNNDEKEKYQAIFDDVQNISQISSEIYNFTSSIYNLIDMLKNGYIVADKKEYIDALCKKALCVIGNKIEDLNVYLGEYSLTKKEFEKLNEITKKERGVVPTEGVVLLSDYMKKINEN
jgi:hypothetical protein